MAPYDTEGIEAARSEPHYTVFIRLPFARGDFVDPPPVSRDSAYLNLLTTSRFNGTQARIKSYGIYLLRSP